MRADFSVSRGNATVILVEDDAVTKRVRVAIQSQSGPSVVFTLQWDESINLEKLLAVANARARNV